VKRVGLLLVALHLRHRRRLSASLALAAGLGGPKHLVAEGGEIASVAPALCLFFLLLLAVLSSETAQRDTEAGSVRDGKTGAGM
jgi:hypothetical protein